MSYYPTRALISAITNATQAVVTFTADHDFTVGEIVSFRVTKDFGMYQINQKRAKVLSMSSDTVTIDIDTSFWDAFSLSNLDAAGTTPPACVPSSSGFIPNAIIPQTNIDDAFDKRPS
jgi:hypothetical protein